MGNNYLTSNKDLNIFIETERPYYNSGSSIQGAVIVHASKNFTFDALLIRIQGQQSCQWFEGSSKNAKKYKGNQHFYTVEHILHKYQDKTLEAGKYAFPFSLQLSENIPGSFQSSKVQAKIQYTLKAYFVNYETPNKICECQIPLLIRQPFRQDIVRYNGQVTTNPKKWGFIEKGQIKLQVNFDRNVGFQGESINIDIFADNTHGSLDISDFLIQLVEYTFVSSNSNACRTYKNVVNRSKLATKVSKGQTKTLQYAYKIPTILNPTAISTLVANYYRLEVSTQLSSFSSNNPCIYAPLFILKKVVDFKQKALNLNLDSGYNVSKTKCIRSGEYLFKKNRNLQVYNFRSQDIITQRFNSQARQ